MSTNNANGPRVSIGIPVYNGEKFIRKRIDTILSQTFQDFELIISDNASTDATSDICKEYAKKDSRIRYIRQKNNIGPIQNYNFVLQQANGKYFTWAATDDLWEPTFISKNIEVLESHPNYVGSMTAVDFFGKYADRYNTASSKTAKRQHVKPISGNYLEKVKLALRVPGTMIYGLFRRESLQRSFPEKKYFRDELILMLNILKHGDFHVIDEVLLHRNADGISSVGRIHSLRVAGVSRLGIIFMYSSFMEWSLKNLGIKFMLKNIPDFILILYVGYGRIILDLARIFKLKFIRIKKSSLL